MAKYRRKYFTRPGPGQPDLLSASKWFSKALGNPWNKLQYPDNRCGWNNGLIIVRDAEDCIIGAFAWEWKSLPRTNEGRETVTHVACGYLHT